MTLVTNKLPIDVDYFSMANTSFVTGKMAPNKFPGISFLSPWHWRKQWGGENKIGMVTIVPRVSDLYDRDNLCDHLNRHAIYFFLSAIHFAYLICNSFRRELRIFYISFFFSFSFTTVVWLVSTYCHRVVTNMATFLYSRAKSFWKWADKLKWTPNMARS